MQCIYCSREIETGKLCESCAERVVSASRGKQMNSLRARGVVEDVFSAGQILRAIPMFIAFVALIVLLGGRGFGKSEAELSLNEKRSVAAELGIPTHTKVIAFVADYCPACNHAESYLQGQAIGYVRADIENDSSAQKAYHMLSPKVRSGIPRFVVGQRVLVGFSPQKFSELLAVAP